MQRYGPVLLLALLCVAAYTVMMLQAVNHWMVGRWYLADVGNIWYCLVNTWVDGFMDSPQTFGNRVVGNHFAWHFTPFFFLLLPLVWLGKYPIPLIAAYNLALCLTPVPLYIMARRQRLPGLVAVALGVLFLGNHFVGSLQLSYHFETFYVLFALAAMAAFPGSRGWPFWLLLGGALSVKEDAAAWLLGWLLLEAWLGERTLRGRALAGAGVCLGYGVVAFAVMKWVGAGQAGDNSDYWQRMGEVRLGADTLQIAGLLLLSTGGLALLGGRHLLPVLIPMPLLLGSFFVTRDLLYYYSYPFLPFLGAAAVAGAGRVWHWLDDKTKRRGGATGVVAAILVVAGVVQYPLPTRTDGYRRETVPVSARHRLRLEVAREKLPQDVPVALQFGLWGVTPWRKGAALLSRETLKDYHYVFADFRAPHGLMRDEYVALMQDLLAEVEAGKREVIYERNDLLVLGPVKK